MKLVLSTSNVIGRSYAAKPPPGEKSNSDLILALRATFADSAVASGQINSAESSAPADWRAWCRKNGDIIEVPAIDTKNSGLPEEREQYDITAKLFYLPSASLEDRAAHTREALRLVLRELHMPSIDLLIVSFPGIYFDEDEECPEKISTRGSVEAQPEPFEGQMQTWQILEGLRDEGLVTRLGIAEFGKDRLEALLDKARIRPSVNQINLRNCCSVPKELLALAKSQNVDLLVHNDYSNILPHGTVRELLGPEPAGAGVLAESVRTGEKRKMPDDEHKVNGSLPSSLLGEVQPQWVIKYTAVVKNRGVVEDKGYFASAELSE